MKKNIRHRFVTAWLLIVICCLTGSAWAQTSCQSIIANITTVSPNTEADDNTLVKICQGQSVSFSGVATFGVSGVGATYEWRMSDGANVTVINGTSATFTFPDQGIYVVDFIVTDTAGCTNTCNTETRTRIVVWVSTTPIFAGTGGPDTVCLHDPIGLVGVVTPVTAIYNCAPPVSDTLYIPDGTGLTYSTSIDVTCFTPCDTISDPNQIESVCLNMEHSYLGDLDIKVRCPSGQEVSLKDYPGDGGTILGNPVATDLPVDDNTSDLTPGIGLTYCFSPSSTNGLLVDPANWATISPYTDPIGNVSASATQVIPGTYEAAGNWNNMIGCPLNGNWTVDVFDHLGADNGYIFYWSIDFNMPTPNYTFTPSYPEQSWGGPGMVSQNGNTSSALPDSAGTYCYTFSVTDDFECTYDTTVCVVVIDPGDPGKDSAATICLHENPVNAFSYLGGDPDLGGTWTGTAITPQGIFDPEVAGVGTFVLTYTLSKWHCDTSAQVTMTVNNDVNVDFDFSLIKSCGGDTVLFTNLSDSGRYWWNFDDNSAVDSVHDNPTHYFTPQGQYDVKLIAQNELGCRDSVTKVVDTRHPIDAVFGLSSDSVCQADNLVYFLDHSTGDLDAWHWDFGDGGMSDEQNPTHSYTEPGTFTVMLVVKELGLPCTDTAYSTVYVDSTPHIILITDNDSVCNGQRVNFSLDYTHTATQILWDFGDGSNHEGTDAATYHSYDNPGQYIVTVTSEHPVCPNVSDMDTILVKPYPIVNLGPDTALCLNGEAYYLSDTINTITPGVKWHWNTGDSTPVLKIVHPGTYTVDADLDGCITSDEIVVRKDCYADIPNSFTPNGDGVNDYFFPRQLLTQGVTGFSMVIFNRWGEKIFETKSIDGRGWDGRLSGKDQPVGVYLYTIDITYKNKAAEHYEGNITLLR